MAKEEIPRGQLSNIILSTLKDGDKYGYEIIERIKELSNGALVIKQPSLYSSLRRMEEQNLISSYWRDSEIGGRRHYYSLTSYGKMYEEKWKTDLSQLFPPKDEQTEDVEDTTSQDNNQTNQIEENKDITNTSEEDNSGTILQQTNLFSPAHNNNEEKEEEEKEQDNENFVQFDLFSNPSMIAEPSVSVFDSISELRKSADDEQTTAFNSKNDILSQLNDIEPLKNDTDIKPNTTDIKQLFNNLKKDSKSFAETAYIEPMNFEEDESTLEKSEPIKIEGLLDEEVFTIDNSPSNEINDGIKESEPESKENIEPSFADTETYNDENIQDNEEYSNFEFIDLNNIDSSNKQSSFNEEFDTEENIDTTNEFENSDINVNELLNETNLQEDIISDGEDTHKIVITSEIDDAVYITEKISDENAPKVRKIEPARFDSYARNYSSEFDKKISDRLEKEQQSYETNETYTTYHSEPSYDEKIEDVSQEDISNNPQEESNNTQPKKYDFNNLNEYYGELGITFGIYNKKQSNTNKTFVYKNKINMLSTVMLSIFTILESIICFIILGKSQQACNFLYVVLPLAFTFIAGYNIVKYYSNKTELVSKTHFINVNWIYELVICIVLILTIISINMLCGMTLYNVSQYLTSTIYLILMAVNLPLSYVFNLLFINKTKIHE